MPKSNRPYRPQRFDVNISVSALVAFGGMIVLTMVFLGIYVYWLNTSSDLANKSSSSDDSDGQQNIVPVSPRSSTGMGASPAQARVQSYEQSFREMRAFVGRSRDSGLVQEIVSPSGVFSITLPNGSYSAIDSHTIAGRSYALDFDVNVQRRDTSELDGQTFEYYILTSPGPSEHTLEKYEMTIDRRRALYLWKSHPTGRRSLFGAIVGDGEFYTIEIRHHGSDLPEQRYRMSKMIFESFRVNS